MPDGSAPAPHRPDPQPGAGAQLGPASTGADRAPAGTEPPGQPTAGSGTISPQPQSGLPDELRFDRLEIVRYAPGFGHAVRDWQRALGSADELPGGLLALLKRGRRGTVWRVPMEIGSGRSGRRAVVAVVKAAPLGKPIDFVRRAIGATPLQRAWRQAVWLSERGVRTAEPMALLLGRARGRPPTELFIMRAIPGGTLLDRLAEGIGPAELAGVAEAVAGLTRSLLAAGRTNRDHKPSNIMVSGGLASEAQDSTGEAGAGLGLSGGLRESTEEDRPAAVLIDTGSLRRVPPRWLPGGGRLRRRAAARMLADLVIEPTGVGLGPPWDLARAVAVRLAEGEAGGLGERARRLAGRWWMPKAVGRRVNQRLAERAAGRAGRLLAEARQRLEAHADPTPTDDPLGRPPPPAA